MSTALDLINAAASEIGVLAEGETLSSQSANDALSTLNRMVDSWSNNNLLIYDTIREVFPLVAGQQAYTIGTGGNFNTARPQFIQTALLQYLTDSPIVELPIRILNQAEWASLIVKTIESDIPIYMYYEASYPLGTINLWPEPETNNNLVLYSAKPLTTFSSLTATLSMPPGYELAIIYNLAVLLCPRYGKAVTPDLAKFSIDSKAALKRINSRPHYLRSDNAIIPRQGAFNWRTGGSGNR